MRIGVYGSAEGPIQDEIREKAREVGRKIARKGHTLVTGGCFGLPYEAVLGAYELGGRCEGFSPATSLKSHKSDGLPVKGFSKLYFVPIGYEHVNNPDACLKYRNISSVASVDAGIIIGGRTGTLNEFTLLYDFGKNIGVLKGSGGITEKVIEVFLECINKSKGSKIIYDKDPVSLVDRLGKL